MDNNMEPWERECLDYARSGNKLADDEIDLITKFEMQAMPKTAIRFRIGFRAAYLRQQSRIDKLRAILQELRDCAEYWSEYDVPVGIVERMDAVLVETSEN